MPRPLSAVPPSLVFVIALPPDLLFQPPLEVREAASNASDARGDRVGQVRGPEAESGDPCSSSSSLLAVCCCCRRKASRRGGGAQLCPPAVRGQGVLEAGVAQQALRLFEGGGGGKFWFGKAEKKEVGVEKEAIEKEKKTNG